MYQVPPKDVERGVERTSVKNGRKEPRDLRVNGEKGGKKRGSLKTDTSEANQAKKGGSSISDDLAEKKTRGV